VSRVYLSGIERGIRNLTVFAHRAIEKSTVPPQPIVRMSRVLPDSLELIRITAET